MKSEQTDLEILRAMLDRQAKRRHGPKDFQAIAYEVKHTDDGIDLALDNDEMGFAFTKAGKLRGVFNWKQ